MFIKKLISLTLAVAFVMGLFASTGFSRSDCGMACCCSSNMPDMKHTVRYEAQINHGCCSQTTVHPCGLTKSQNLELPMYTLLTGRINSGTSVNDSVSLTESSSVNELAWVRNMSPVDKIPIQFSPIYLQHLSLLI